MDRWMDGQIIEQTMYNNRPHPNMKLVKVCCHNPWKEGMPVGKSHLEGAQSQLQGQANAKASTVRQEVEDDVMNSKQWDKEKC